MQRHKFIKLLSEAKIKSEVEYGEVDERFIEGFKHALKITRRTSPLGKPVKRFGNKFEPDEDYDSISEAARDNNCSIQAINIAIKEKRKGLGFFWEYI